MTSSMTVFATIGSLDGSAGPVKRITVWGIFGTHFQMNFWLKGEQQVCKYLSGCIQDLDLTAPSVQWSDQALRFLDQTAVDCYQAN